MVVIVVVALDGLVMEVVEVMVFVGLPKEQQQGLARRVCVGDSEMLVAMARLTRRIVSTGCEATHLNK